MSEIKDKAPEASAPEASIGKADNCLDLATKIEAQAKEIETLKARFESLEGTVSELLETKETPATSTPAGTSLVGHVFTVGKKKYKLKFPSVNVDGKDYSEDDLLLDEPLTKKLVESNPRLFTEA